MRFTLIAGATALTIALAAGSANAQATSAPAADPAASSAAPDATAPAAAVTVGQPVKDNTGATIGEITAVKPDASGKPTATVKMGADSFAVDTSALAVKDGAALINASQAELKGMMAKSAPPAKK
jgi:hypothetical protein